MLDWIIQNRELIKLIYGILITLICVIIVLRTNKLFHLSMHKGIRHLRNAFFFYGIAFIIRYFFGATLLYDYIPIAYTFITKAFFEFFLIMAGFFLLYSLLWKKFESSEETYFTSLFNTKIFLFYLMTLIIVILDLLLQTYYYLFASQVFIFILAAIISYKNYKKNKEKPFPKFYFAAMLLSLVAWALNAISAILFKWNRNIITCSYFLNLIIFFLFLYGVIKLTK